MTRVIESDVCIIGSGISAAMVAHKLARTTNRKIVVVEAGNDNPPLRERYALRGRYLAYGESPWPKDHLDGYEIEGPLQSRSMQVGGLAMHWGGVTPRWSPEDFRTKSMFGIGNDWPISYDDLEPAYQEAESLLGVSGEQGPATMDPRSKPFPMPALPLTYNLGLLKEWAGQAGIAMWSQPSAKNSRPYDGRAECCRNDTCTPICPTGAKYTPDHTWNRLRASNAVTLYTNTLVRRLTLDASSKRIVSAEAVQVHAPRSARGDKGDKVEFRAKQFVVAGGYVWSAHLLLLSNVANSSGTVGKYLTGHRNQQAFIALPLKLYPGINTQHSLVSKQFMRAPVGERYLRHDLRVWESPFARGPRLRDDAGRPLLGDAILQDWRARTKTGVARVRAYYDVIPDRSSELTLDSSRRNAWGDPLPKLAFRDAPESAALREYSNETIRALFQRMASAGNGTVLQVEEDDGKGWQDHPAGGCRMGSDPATSVVDSWGRSHDHENLFVVGAPTCVSGSCANSTLTFCALALRSAEEMAR